MTLRFPAAPDTAALEEGSVLSPRFGRDGLITVVTTDAETGAPLMVAHMNAQALALTLETGQAHYWSRSRQALWHKGATSGQIQHVVDMRIDCDQDALWLSVRQDGAGCCHVGYPTCFYRVIQRADGRAVLVIDRTKGARGGPAA